MEKNAEKFIYRLNEIIAETKNSIQNVEYQIAILQDNSNVEKIIVDLRRIIDKLSGQLNTAFQMKNALINILELHNQCEENIINYIDDSITIFKCQASENTIIKPMCTIKFDEVRG